MFLLDANSHLPYQYCWLKPPWRTLAYAQALQYWTEKTNPPVPNEPHHLVMCVHELRQGMRRYMTFSDYDVFEGLMHGLPGAEVEEATHPDPVKHLLADGPAALMVAPSVSENMSATLITTPAISKDHPWCIGGWAGQSSHPSENNWWCEESAKTRISEMGQSTSISYGGLCGEYSLQPRRPEMVLLQL